MIYLILDNVNILSLVPPLISIILVLITKESIFSLIIGGGLGCLIYCNLNPLKSLEMMLNIIATKMIENIYIIIFLALLGSLVMIMTSSGGALAYGEYISNKIKTKTGAQLATILFGIIIFIDDYFNCLTIGAAMGPIYDRYHISREKLAYLIDSTASPICIIAPISSWVAIILSTLDGCGINNSFEIFLKTIPYNFYAILTIIMVFSIIILNKDFGPMLNFEKITYKNNTKSMEDKLYLEENKNIVSQINRKGRSYDLIIPIFCLIIFSFLSLLYNGGYFKSNITILDALGYTNSQKSLSFGATIALIVSFFLTVILGNFNFKDFINNIIEGIKSMVPAYMILILSWMVGDVCYQIGTGEYIKYIVRSSSIPNWILPTFIFIISAFLALTTGTAWGTFGILIPVVVGISKDLNEDLLIIFIAATLAGAAYGNHSSPISDTCILSSTGAQCSHINHVLSQMPYAGLVAIICLFNYISISFIHSLLLIYLLSIILIISMIYLLSKKAKIDQ